jgi:lysozyme family protein
MKENKTAAISLVLKEEGGYTNNPADPGGPTNFGITIGDAKHYLEPNADANYMKHMTVEQAIGIYGPKYWDKVLGDQLPAGLDYTLMDYGVNSGVGRAIKVIQRVVGVTDDGVFGPATLAQLRTWATFGKGWGARVARVKATSLKMAG